MYLCCLDTLTLLLMRKLQDISKYKLICFKNALQLESIFLYQVQHYFIVIEIKVHFSLPRQSKNLLQPRVLRVMQADIYICRILVNKLQILTFLTFSHTKLLSLLQEIGRWAFKSKKLQVSSLGWGKKNEECKAERKNYCMKIN